MCLDMSMLLYSNCYSTCRTDANTNVLPLLGVQAPESIMIATDSHIYTLKRYLSSSKGFYHDIVFLTMDESGMEMFYDMSESGRLVLRATGPFGETVDFALKAPVAGVIGEGVEVDENWFDGVRDVIAAWDLYVQAGGTKQDLTAYANAIEVAETQREDVDTTEPSNDEPMTEETPEPTEEPAPVYDTLQKGSKGETVQERRDCRYQFVRSSMGGIWLTQPRQNNNRQTDAR